MAQHLKQPEGRHVKKAASGEQRAARRSNEQRAESREEFEVRSSEFEEAEYAESLEKREKRKEKREKGRGKKKLILPAVLLVLAAAVVLGGFLVTKSETILPNVTVRGIEVGKMTQEEAAAALKAGGWETVTGTPLEVSLLGKVPFEVDPVQAGAVLSSERAVKAAYAYGHSGNIFENLFSYVERLLSPIDVNEYNSGRKDDYLSAQIMQGLDSMNQYFGLEECRTDFENGELRTKKGWGQIVFDQENLKSAIYRALEAGQTKLEYSELTKELTMPDFAAIDAGLNKTAVDAKYSDDGKFEVIDETDACEFDVAEAEKLWTAAKAGDEVIIPMQVTKPETTGEMLRDRLFHDMLGAMSTRYTNSADTRCSNVRLCASKINESIVYPGEIWSYNETVGARTEEAGFLPAPAYVGLDSEETVKDEIGGGACQVSSTTYAATLFAFLETAERSCHIYPVNYMQLGIDATVTIPEDGQAVDFKFKNNKNYPVKIVAYTNETEEEKKLTVEIWGTLEEGDYMPTEFDASYSWNQDYDRFIEAAYADRAGYKIKLDHDVYTDPDPMGTGVLTSTQTWRRVYDGEGNLIEETIVNMPNPATGAPSMDQYHQHP